MAMVAALVLDPHEPHARRPGRRSVRHGVFADVDRVPRCRVHGLERHVQDAWIGLGVAAALGRHDHIEQRSEAGGREARTLHAVDPVRDDAEPEAPAQRVQRRAATRQPVAARREPIEVGLAQAAGAALVSAQVLQEPTEALPGERRLRGLAAAERGPQLRVDALVGVAGGGGTRQAEGPEGLLQGRALGLVEVEKRVVDVEQDGAQAGQATWRGR